MSEFVNILKKNSSMITKIPIIYFKIESKYYTFPIMADLIAKYKFGYIGYDISTQYYLEYIINTLNDMNILYKANIHNDYKPKININIYLLFKFNCLNNINSTFKKDINRLLKFYVHTLKICKYTLCLPTLRLSNLGIETPNKITVNDSIINLTSYPNIKLVLIYNEIDKKIPNHDLDMIKKEDDCNYSISSENINDDISLVPHKLFKEEPRRLL